jgi:hypothetical protein
VLYSGKQIVSKIKGHIRKRGGAYPAWVVGVSRNARKELFNQHGVRKDKDRWIFMHAQSPSVARRVKAYLMDKLGILGRTSVEDKTADFVYAYKKVAHTRQASG